MSTKETMRCEFGGYQCCRSTTKEKATNEGWVFHGGMFVCPVCVMRLKTKCACFYDTSTFKPGQEPKRRSFACTVHLSVV